MAQAPAHQFFVADLLIGVLADRFEDGDDVHWLALEVAWKNGPAVNEIEAGSAGPNP